MGRIASALQEDETAQGMRMGTEARGTRTVSTGSITVHNAFHSIHRKEVPDKSKHMP